MTITVYFDSIDGCDEEIFLAATARGLCFVSNNYQEMQDTLAKPGVSNLILNEQQMKPYTTLFSQYFQGDNVDFTVLPLDIKGTNFQQLVWKALVQIPYGKLCSYSDIAELINKPTAVRAVANAIGKNPILVMIPCHRVIGKNGQLTGFRNGLALKKQLLQLEGSLTSNHS
ncbi:MAG: methylated-DNA--[protein]-cysteine S-methyltransferase [Kurthia sp.]|nr:methylated-DNA--[protein]-cysteine S-methyltransferase [Candidatus Kurthia equi]